jgi:predicted phosphodiesterase
LDYYYSNEFYFISLGDSEELWENSLSKVKKYNVVSLELEKKFIEANRFTKIFGNHDLYWDNDPLAGWQLKKVYGQEVKVYEGVVLKSVVNSSEFRAGSIDSELRTKNADAYGQHPDSYRRDSELKIFLTHGHQGDASSDGNWFSKFFVARIWAPLQAYLKINPNTPAYNAGKKTKHNQMMYDWSSQQENLLLITGHTHQPVFESLTHLERLYKKLLGARNSKDMSAAADFEKEINKRKHQHSNLSIDYLHMKPSYFNSGCCCFSDGDITGVEIAEGKIRLVKWGKENGREILEEAALDKLQRLL